MAEEVGAAPQGAVRACGRKEKQIVLARTRSGHHLPVLTLIICLPSPPPLHLSQKFLSRVSLTISWMPSQDRRVWAVPGNPLMSLGAWLPAHLPRALGGEASKRVLEFRRAERRSRHWRELMALEPRRGGASE